MTIPLELVEVLRKLKCSEYRLRNAALESCLVSDLGVRGDDLEDFKKILSEEYAVDMTCFRSQKYSLDEGSYLFPRSLWTFGRRRDLKRLPLGKVLRALETKRWSDR